MSRIFSFEKRPRIAVPKTHKGLSRRTMLRGAGGVALGLPFLEAMRGAKSTIAAGIPGQTAAGNPKRFLVFFTPNGTIPKNWVPEGEGRDFTFSRILKPLETFREKLLVIDGVDQTGTGGDGHQNGMQGMLTGQTLNPGPYEGGGGDTAGWANGISVDQRIANVIGGDTPLKSLELSVQSGNTANNWNRMSLSGADLPIAPEQSPFKAYDRLFSDFNVSPDQAALADDRSRVVLDAVQENFRSLKAKVGVEDRKRLDEHMNTLAEIEGRLGKRPVAALDACEAPVLGAEIDVNKNDNFPVVGQLHMDLLVMALACDMTRVGSLMWDRSVGNARHSWIDSAIDTGHHTMSHDGDSNEDSVEKLTKINTWYAEQLAYLLQKLDAIPEGDGTMLDNTVIFWTNELAKGNSHSRNDQHYVVAGGADYFEMGRCLKFDYDNSPKHNDLLLSFVHSMGIEDESFGKADWCSGPLSGLTG